MRIDLFDERSLGEECNYDPGDPHEFPELQFPFETEVIIALGYYGKGVLLDAETEVRYQIFDMEDGNVDFLDIFEHCDAEVPEDPGVYKLKCRCELVNEPGEYGTILSSYPTLKVLDCTPIQIEAISKEATDG